MSALAWMIVVNGVLTCTTLWLVAWVRDLKIDARDTRMDLSRVYGQKIASLEDEVAQAKWESGRLQRKCDRYFVSMKDVKIGDVCKVYGTEMVLLRYTRDSTSKTADFVDKETYEREQGLRL